MGNQSQEVANLMDIIKCNEGIFRNRVLEIMGVASNELYRIVKRARYRGLIVCQGRGNTIRYYSKEYAAKNGIVEIARKLSTTDKASLSDIDLEWCKGRLWFDSLMRPTSAGISAR